MIDVTYRVGNLLVTQCYRVFVSLFILNILDKQWFKYYNLYFQIWLKKKKLREV
jgi:hypothetical protein